MSPAEYLKLPYGRTVVPEPDGTFRGEIIEFPGCIAVGDTAPEALANLEDVALSWLEATIAKGQRVPEPVENNEFSGKLVVRLPKSLHRKATHVAAREGVSLNQFIVTSVAEQVGSRAQSLVAWPSVTNFNVHVRIGADVNLTPIRASSGAVQKQFATSADHQMLGFELPALREKAHA